MNPNLKNEALRKLDFGLSWIIHTLPDINEVRVQHVNAFRLFVNNPKITPKFHKNAIPKAILV
jgi:hypothetical protein